MELSFVCHGSRVCGTMLANRCHTWEDGMKPFNEQSTWLCNAKLHPLLCSGFASISNRRKESTLKWGEPGYFVPQSLPLHLGSTLYTWFSLHCTSNDLLNLLAKSELVLPWIEILLALFKMFLRDNSPEMRYIEFRKIFLTVPCFSLIILQPFHLFKRSQGTLSSSFHR